MYNFTFIVVDIASIHDMKSEKLNEER